MEKQKILKYASFIVVILIIILGAYFVIKSEQANAPTNNVNIKTPDPSTPSNTSGQASSGPSATGNLTKAQNELLAKLQTAVNTHDFESFADLLQTVYKNQWISKEFVKVESDMYVYATNTYWVKGDLTNSLRVSTLVFNKVPEAWRFRYLRIVTLEKYGRNAFNAGDLKTAEDYANQILQIMYRPEGANLLADIYIMKIKDNIKDNKIDLARQNLNFISGFDVSKDRVDTLNNLRSQLGAYRM
jgi:hypothetical protein